VLKAIETRYNGLRFRSRLEACWAVWFGPLPWIRLPEILNRALDQVPFDNILDRVTGSDPSVTDYVLDSTAKCPSCRREILEKTLIEPV